MNLNGLYFTNDWSLFLDRDGVISHRLPDDYVRQWQEFAFLPGALDALKIFGGIFGKIIVVSNQQGVGKGLMSPEGLMMIDKEMKKAVAMAGGRIDASYYSPYLASENHPDRKPGTGMGLKAKSDFPEIDLSRSIMVGDSMTDMEFGRNLGMITVFISESRVQHELIDLTFRSLYDFALSLGKSMKLHRGSQS